MVDQSHLSLVVGETDAKEAPCVPRVDLGIGLFVGDERLLGMLDPKDMAARGTHDHLLWCGDEVVVQHLAVGIQDRLIDHFCLEVATFKPSLAVRALEIV